MIPAPQAADPLPGPGGPRRGLAVATVIVACVAAVSIAGNVLGGTGHRPGEIGWLIPAVILGFVFLRLPRRRP